MARILIVDDDQVSRVQLGALLDPLGHEVQYAPNGEVALRMYTQRKFHACVVDLFMPVKNGLQTIRDLKDHDPDARIVAITGMDNDMNLELAEEFGAVQRLTKPVDPEKLRTAVGAALAG